MSQKPQQPPNSLEKYQQNMQQSVEQELQRQQLQNTPGRPLNEAEQSIVQRLTTSVMDAVSKGLENAAEYGKDVVTGKKLWEGLKENDGALDGWMSHGSTELANMLLHGHPAPVYARTLSPALQQTQVDVGLHGEEVDTPVAQPSEMQAAQDVQLSNAMSLEMYQRGMQQEHYQQLEQEASR